MASRSAKDSVLRSQRFLDLMTAEFAKLQYQETMSGKEAVENFIHSGRTYGDLKQRELLGENFSMDLVLREWNPNLTPELEFRGFVYNSQFTCLTQYYSMIYVPEIHRKKELFQKSIVTFWEEKIKHVIPLKDYCIDFTVLEGNSENNVIVIELNPPAPLASPVLFDYLKEKEIIENGPFEFRVVTAPVLGAKKKIAARARQLFDAMFPNYAALEKLVEEKEKLVKENNDSELGEYSCALL